jgi:hypothetical protein
MLAIMGKAKDALKLLEVVPERAKEANLPEQQARNLEINVLQTRIQAARQLKRGADAEKQYGALVAEVQKEKVRKAQQSLLDYNQGLVLLAKRDPKGAVEVLRKCLPDDHTCGFTLAEAQRAAGDKKGAAQTVAKLKAAPSRNGDYLFYAARVK